LNLSVVQYRPELKCDWESIVECARNSTFLHSREFMDYHADRFNDASLVLYDDAGVPRSAFAACRVGDTVHSHAGLTYGGLLMPRDITQSICLKIFYLIAEFYRKIGVCKILYKPVPRIFHRYPAEEDLYALFYYGANLTRRDTSAAIDLYSRIPYSKGRAWSIKKANRESSLRISRSQDFNDFHKLLTLVLERHGATPVHLVKELNLLHSRFPHQIMLYEVRRDNDLLAGALIFDFITSAHTQYLAVSDFGRTCFALDYLIDHLLTEEYRDRRYFSFGISTEEQGMKLNEGLHQYKEAFGARSVSHDQYEWII
jgi:hypothetical protein